MSVILVSVKHIKATDIKKKKKAFPIFASSYSTSSHRAKVISAKCTL